jgi:hypothetical protein
MFNQFPIALQDLSGQVFSPVFSAVHIPKLRSCTRNFTDCANPTLILSSFIILNIWLNLCPVHPTPALAVIFAPKVSGQ